MGNQAERFNNTFCIPAFIILFRETLEAAVLVAVLLQYLQRAKRPELRKQVWWGVAVGGIITLIMMFSVLTIYYYLDKNIFNETVAYIVEGTILAGASIFITYFLVTHLAPGMKQKDTWESKWEHSMDKLVQDTIDGSTKNAFFWLSFTTVFREGFESVVFTIVLIVVFPISSMPLGIFGGIIAGCVFGWALYHSTKDLSLSTFFRIMGAFLALMCAGFLAHASYEFQKGGVFGVWSCGSKCSVELEAPYGYLAGYAGASDVGQHAAIDLDVRAMQLAAEAGDFDGAWASYSEGGNSRKGDEFRTVRGFSKILVGEPTYTEFRTYHGDPLYADNYVRASLWDRLAGDSSAKEDPRPELFADATLSDPMATQMAVKGAQYQNTWIYSTHELYSALQKCRAGTVDDATGAPHAWDEGWAFYAGSQVGANGQGAGYLSYTLADKRCGNFMTCAEDTTAATWRLDGNGNPNGEANSLVNAKLVRLYQAGLTAVKDDTRCVEAAKYVDEIIAQMTVPLIQGALRYAWRADPAGGGESLSSDGEVLAEMHAFVRAVVPRVAACDAAAGEVLAKNAAVPDALDESAVLVPDGFAAVKEALESTYACLAVTCAEVGGLAKDGAYVAGMEPCADGSTLDDDAAYFEDLAKIAFGRRPRIASYRPATDVTVHALIDRDVRDMQDAAKEGDFDGAWKVYSKGANSRKGDEFRTLRGFSKSLAGEPTYDEYFAHWGDATYADNYVRAALWDRLAEGSSAKRDPRPPLFATATLSDPMALQMAVKGAQYQNAWIYSTHQMWTAIEDCKAGETDIGGAPHAWDEAWAFYAGSLEGADGRGSGYLAYALADKRCGNFKTCAADTASASWRSLNDGANSLVNAKLLRLYQAGLEDVQDDDKCGDAEWKANQIVAQMTVPLIQGALRYAWRSDPAGGGESLSSDGEVLAEMHAFVRAVLPRVAACDADAAKVLEDNYAIPDELDESAVLVPDGFREVKKALESTYECLLVTCTDVGGLDNGEGYVEGMEPCNDGSSLEDMASDWARMQEVADGAEQETCENDDDEGGGWHSYRRLEAIHTSETDEQGGQWVDAMVRQDTEQRRLKGINNRGRMASCDDHSQREIAWVNYLVWDVSGCCDTSNWFFFFMMTLFWYRAEMTRLEIIVWCAYWPFLFIWGYYKVSQIKDFNHLLDEEHEERVRKEKDSMGGELPFEEGKEDVVFEDEHVKVVTED